MWGATTTAFSFTGSVAQGIATWAITGLGLCLVIPNVQSLTADYYEEQDRGKAFGVLYLTSAGGAALGTLWATNVGSSPPLMCRLPPTPHPPTKGGAHMCEDGAHPRE